MVQIQAGTNYGPQGLGGTTSGETIFTWKESFKMKHQSNFNQTIFA
jgi:hypothetical protein